MMRMVLFFIVVLAVSANAASLRYYVKVHTGDSSKYYRGRIGTESYVNLTPGEYILVGSQVLYSYWNYPCILPLKTVRVVDTSVGSWYPTDFTCEGVDGDADSYYVTLSQYADSDVYFDAFVDGAEPTTYLVNYQIKNETQGPVGIAVVAGGIEYQTVHVEPITETEAAATQIHPWIEQSGDDWADAYIKVYQDGVVLGQSPPIPFVLESSTGNMVSELHAVEVSTPPLPKLNISCTAMNGLASSLDVVAEVNTSSGFYVLSLGMVSGGSYYDPAVSTLVEILELAEGEVPTGVVFKLMDGGDVVASQSIPISLANDDFEYFASGVVNVSGIPDVENPNPPPDPNDPPDGGDPNPNPEPPSKPPAPNPANPDPDNPNPIDYEKMAQAMEFALNNQKVSGVNDSVQNLTDVVKGQGGGDVDLSGVESRLDTISSNVDGSFQTYPAPVVGDGYSATNSTYKSDLDGMDSGVLGRVVDGLEARLRVMFVIQLPTIGQESVYAVELPGYMNLNLPELRIDLADYPQVPTVRNVLLFCLYLWAFFMATRIVQGAFE